MTDKPDTSAEAVNNLAETLLYIDMPETAATLRALLAERDAARASLVDARNVLKDASLAMVAYHRLTLGDRLGLSDRIHALLALPTPPAADGGKG